MILRLIAIPLFVIAIVLIIAWMLSRNAGSTS